MKKGVISFFIIVSILIVVPTNDAHGSDSIDYYFNGKSNEQTAAMLFIENSRVHVPFRAIFEELGAKVTWNAEKEQVVAKQGDTKLTMQLGETTIKLNDELLFIDQPAVMKKSHLFVPIRFVAETFDASVSWDGTSRTVAINSENSNGNVEDDRGQMPMTHNNVDVFSWVPFWPGQSKELLNDIGEPDDVVGSQYPFVWDIYLNNYESYIQVGHSEDTIEAVFLPLTEYWYKNNEISHITRDDVLDELGEPQKLLVKDNRHYDYGIDPTWDFFKLKDMYVTVFYDLWRENAVTAIQAVKADIEEQSTGFYGDTSNDLRESYEKQMWHVTNTERKRMGIDMLQWHEATAEVGRLHSDDMIENDYFSHENLQGMSPFDRLREYDILFKTAGENLARRQISPFHATYNLLDSSGHRKNLLQDNFKHVGIGVGFEENKPYFTQKFITEYDFQ